MLRLLLLVDVGVVCLRVVVGGLGRGRGLGLDRELGLVMCWCAVGGPMEVTLVVVL